jgi:hypothetical protein
MIAVEKDRTYLDDSELRFRGNECDETPEQPLLFDLARKT